MKTQKPPFLTTLWDALRPAFALVALPLTTRAGTSVLSLDVIPRIASGVIVVNVLLDRVPWNSVSHSSLVMSKSPVYA